jgi:hypothetical protein
MMFKEIMPHLTFLDIATAPLGLKPPRPRHHARSKAEILEGRSSDQAYENSVDYTVRTGRFSIGSFECGNLQRIYVVEFIHTLSFH